MNVTITEASKRGEVAGKPPDFAEFVRRRSRPMLRSAWLLTGGDWALAEDLAQTALGEVWRHWDRVAPRPRACRRFRTAAGQLRRQRRLLAVRSGQQRNDPGERPERRSPGLLCPAADREATS